MRRIAALLALAAFAILLVGLHTTQAQTTPAALYAQAPGRAHVETVSKGLHLSLSLAKQRYPANAIVQATMRVTNVTTHGIGLGSTSFYDCRGTFAPHAVVMSDGTQVFPPIVVGESSPSCSNLSGPTMTLRAGATLTSREYLLLRGPQVRAFVTLAGSRAQHGVQTRPPLVGTPILSVTLTQSDAPTVTVQKGSVPMAHIVRPSYGHGLLFVGSGWSRLARHGTVGEPGFVGIERFENAWVRQTSLTIRARLMSGYTRVVEWHIVAGWLGHSAASVNSRQP